MNAEEFDKLLDAHLDGALDSEGCDKMECALKEDASRRREIEAHNRLTILLSQIAPAPAPASLRESIMAKVREEAASLPAHIDDSIPSVSFFESVYSMFRRWQFQAVATACMIGAIAYAVIPHLQLGQTDNFTPRIVENRTKEDGENTSPGEANTNTKQQDPAPTVKAVRGVSPLVENSESVPEPLAFSVSHDNDTALLGEGANPSSVKITPALNPTLSPIAIGTPSPAPRPRAIALATTPGIGGMEMKKKGAEAVIGESVQEVTVITPTPEIASATETPKVGAMEQKSGVSKFLSELAAVDTNAGRTETRGPLFGQYTRKQSEESPTEEAGTDLQRVANVSDVKLKQESPGKNTQDVKRSTVTNDGNARGGQTLDQNERRAGEYMFWPSSATPASEEPAWLRSAKPKPVETAKATDGLSAWADVLGNLAQKGASRNQSTPTVPAVRSFTPASTSASRSKQSDRTPQKPAGAPVSPGTVNPASSSAAPTMMSWTVYLVSSSNNQTAGGAVKKPTVVGMKSAGSVSRPAVSILSTLTAQQVEAHLKKAGVRTSLIRSTKGYTLKGQVPGKDAAWVAGQLAKLGIVDQRHYVSAGKTAKGYYTGTIPKTAKSSTASFTFTLFLITQ